MTSRDLKEQQSPLENSNSLSGVEREEEGDGGGYRVRAGDGGGRRVMVGDWGGRRVRVGDGGGRRVRDRKSVV